MPNVESQLPAEPESESEAELSEEPMSGLSSEQEIEDLCRNIEQCTAQIRSKLFSLVYIPFTLGWFVAAAGLLLARMNQIPQNLELLIIAFDTLWVCLKLLSTGAEYSLMRVDKEGFINSLLALIESRTDGSTPRLRQCVAADFPAIYEEMRRRESEERSESADAEISR